MDVMANSGTQAIKIKPVKGETGQAITSNIADSKVSNQRFSFCTTYNLGIYI